MVSSFCFLITEYLPHCAAHSVGLDLKFLPNLTFKHMGINQNVHFIIFMPIGGQVGDLSFFFFFI